MVHRLQRYFWQRPWTTRMVIVLFCMLVVSLVTACGSMGGNAQSPTQTPVLQTQKCGSVQTNPRGLTLKPVEAKQAEACFWQAYQKCQPATLEFDSSSLDTVAIHTFSIRGSGSGQRCSVTDALQKGIVPNSPSDVGTYACTGVAMKTDGGLSFSGCGDEGDVVVP